MRISGKPFFTTLVAVLLAGAAAHAAVDDPSLDIMESEGGEEPAQPMSREMRDSIDIAPAPPAPPKSSYDQPYFYRYHNELSAYAGLVMDSQSAKDGKSTLDVFGATIDVPMKSRAVYEAGGDWLSNNSGVLHLSRRFDFARSRFRPYALAGAGLRIVPADQLVTLARLKNYQVRGSIGFEKLLWDPWSLRAEAQAAISADSFQAGVIVGAAYGY